MKYATIKKNDIANGTGVRTSLFVSGCTHHCKNCFNSVTWDFNYGEEFTSQVQDDIIESMKPAYVDGLTLLGGEPMEIVNQAGLAPFIEKVKKVFPKKTIWCFTGYLFEDLLKKGKVHSIYTDSLLKNIDVLVDGEFVDSQKDISLIFKGSKNQRTIDVKETLKSGKVVLLNL